MGAIPVKPILAFVEKPMSTIYVNSSRFGGGGNWWELAGRTTIAAWQGVGAASLAASYVNLANPGTYDLTLQGSGVTWSAANGWGDNWATNNFFKTGYTPANTTTRSVFIRAIRSNTNGYTKMLANGNFSLMLSPEWNPGGAFYGNGNFVEASPESDGDNVQGFAGLTPYLNGTSKTAITSGGSVQVVPVYLGGGYSNTTTCNNPYQGIIKAVVIFNEVLDSSEVSTLTAAMQAL